MDYSIKIRTCSKCGFILGTRPNMKDRNGICLACLNKDKKNGINWKERQEWLTDYIKKNQNSKSEYDCVIGVSGGKDSCSIVKRLVENHNIKRPLLVHVCDEFTASEAGRYNLNNLVQKYNADIINFRCQPQTFVEATRKDFLESLHPLKWIEEQIYKKPFEIAKAFDINLVFMGENPAFEYGENEECDIFHPETDENVKVIYMGAIYPYSNIDSLLEAKKMGFKDLNSFEDWCRQGSADPFTQIDSIGYMVHHWCKFIKFGFQRTSDLACRLVREGILTKEQAEQRIKDSDWICDPLAKRDFCRTINISEKEFDETIDRFANTDILTKDVNGNWRRKDLI